MLAQKRWSAVAAAVAFGVAMLTSSASAEEFTAKVVSVPDGDTINVQQGDSKERVILYGIDCPEIGQPSGEEARTFTDQRCFRKTVTIQDRGRDSKGRTIGVVFLPDGSNLNEELVRAGLAWWSDKYAPNDAKLKQLHLAAQAAHKGLWADANPVPPWIWRNGQRNVQARVVPASN